MTIPYPLYSRRPGCNVWMPFGGGWGRRCGDLDCEGVTHLCATCRAAPSRAIVDERPRPQSEWTG